MEKKRGKEEKPIQSYIITSVTALGNQSFIPVKLSGYYLKYFIVLSHLWVDWERCLSISSCTPVVEGLWKEWRDFLSETSRLSLKVISLAGSHTEVRSPRTGSKDEVIVAA